MNSKMVVRQRGISADVVARLLLPVCVTLAQLALSCGILCGADAGSTALVRTSATALAGASATIAAGAGSTVLTGAGSFEAALSNIRKNDLAQHVSVLASDALEGREAGSRGGQAAGAYIVQQLGRLSLTPGGEDNSYFQYFGRDYRNIIALVPGSDPKLKNEYILIGAHYDHVGYGSRENSLGPIGQIHNGADDNGSGAAGLLELADALSALQARPKRSVLLAFWDAEEKGLLGSEHWVAYPTVPLNSVGFVVNIDMIGRLRENNVEVYGVRTAAGLRRLLCEHNAVENLQFDFNWDNQRDSDHYPFYQRRIPYLMLFTRKHDDYHRPSDDADKINAAGIEEVARLLFRTVYELADLPQLPKFREEAFQEHQQERNQFLTSVQAEPSRLGIVWDPQAAETGTIRVTAIDDKSSAQRAGMHVGDTIISFGGRKVHSAHEFRTLVMASDKKVAAVLERSGAAKPMTVDLELTGNPRRIGITWRTDPAEPGTVILTRIAPQTPAEAAGLQPGDRIYAVDGKQFPQDETFRDLVSAHDDIDLTVERDGQIKHVQIRRASATVGASAPAAAKPAAARSK